MAHDITGTDAYPVRPITVPDGGDTRNAASVQAGFQDCADGIATLGARLGGVTTGSTEWSYPTSRGRSTRIPAVGGVAVPVYLNAGVATDVDGNLWRPHYTIASGAGPGGRDLVTTTGKVFTGLPIHQYIRPLNRLIMNGGVLASVEFAIHKGTAQATSTNRVSVELFKTDLLGARTSISFATANASSGDETVFVAAVETINLATAMYYLQITSSLGADTSHVDLFVGANMNWSDPGPRN